MRTTTQKLEILNKNHYYPFGMEQDNPRYAKRDEKYKYKYQEQERQDELNLNWDSFKWRNYDYALGRFMSIDPLVEQTEQAYIAMSNNPVNRVDSDGCADNPVVDAVTGNMIGTTESGMEGEIIVMDARDFTQGMTDEKALEVGSYISEANMGSYRKEVIENIVNSRPDRDGIVTLEEAQLWRKEGDGQPLFIDFAKLNFKGSYLNVQDFESGNVQLINFFNEFDIHLFNSNVLYRPAGSSNPLSNVHGTIYLQLINSTRGEVKPLDYTKPFDIYDFASWRKLIRGGGKDFDFYGYGKGTINLTPGKAPDEFYNPNKLR